MTRSPGQPLAARAGSPNLGDETEAAAGRTTRDGHPGEQPADYWSGPELLSRRRFTWISLATVSMVGLAAVFRAGPAGAQAVAFVLMAGAIFVRILSDRGRSRPDGGRLLDQFHWKPGPSRLGRKAIRVDGYEYDVCLSFAGEQRSYVDAVAEGLRGQGLRVFYDRHEQVSLWGKELSAHLDWVYRRAARYCVLFVSADYAEKLWPCRERESAQSRAVAEGAEYILPARFDDTKIPGLRSTVGYLDLRKIAPDELVQLIGQKIALDTDQTISPVVDSSRRAQSKRPLGDMTADVEIGGRKTTAPCIDRPMGQRLSGSLAATLHAAGRPD